MKILKFGGKIEERLKSSLGGKGREVDGWVGKTCKLGVKVGETRQKIWKFMESYEHERSRRK